MSDTVRVNIAKHDPGPYKALLTASTKAGKIWAASGLDPRLIDLVRIRASQLNGCTGSESRAGTIAAKHSGKCLDVVSASSSNAAGVSQYACGTGTDQRFAPTAPA